MAIKAFCEKLMAINDGPSLMDHHRHVCNLAYANPNYTELIIEGLFLISMFENIYN